MPTETLRRGTIRWRAVVKIGGKVVASKWFGSGPKEHRQALLWEEAQKTELARQQTSLTVPRLSDWTLGYLEDVLVRCSKSTFAEKRTAMGRLLRSTGDVEVTRITPSVAQVFLKEQCVTRSGYSANRDRKNLAAAWRWGQRFAGLPTTENPFLAVDKFPEERDPRYVPSEEDFSRVLEIAQGQDRVMLTAFLYTAARRDELFRLTWADVDFKENVLLLRTRKTRGASWRVDPLPILPELRQALVWWWDARPYKSAEHVFTCLDDSPSPNHDAGGRFKYRQHVMKKLCKRAGVKPFGFHAIRHLRAVMLYKGGALVHEVQKWLRHESASTTERYLKSLGCDLDRLRAAATRSLGQGKVIPFAPNGRTPGITSSEGSGYPPVYPLANKMATEM